MFYLAPLFSLWHLITAGISMMLLGLLLGSFGHQPFFRVLASDPLAGFDWSELQATQHLEYVPCYEDRYCAKLEVPMDWSGNDSVSKVQLAIVRLPAQVPVDDPGYGGAVIVNPGGPGGSGVSLVSGPDGRRVQHVVSSWPSPEKSYDVIGFDPRGVGHSTPVPLCNHNISARDISSAVLCDKSYWFARGQKMNEMCDIVHSNGTIIEYMTTPDVARDMLELVSRHGEWRETKRSRNSFELPDAQYDRRSEKLQYWGFSYGTVLGATFAVMFPDRISRMVLDGVKDIDAYYHNMNVRHETTIEAAMKVFYDRCALAGPSHCSIAGGNATTAQIEAFVNSLLENSRQKPELCHAAERYKGALISSLSTPMGEGSNFTRFSNIIREVFIRQSQNILQEIDKTPVPISPAEELLHIYTCNDGRLSPNRTEGDAIAHYEKFTSKQPIWGFVDAVTREQCFGYPLKSSQMFKFKHEPVETTSIPILWVGNVADPRTPLWNARKSQQRFPGSGLLVVNGTGHTSLATQSRCADAEIRRYFHEGTIIQYERTCQAVLPWCEAIGDYCEKAWDYNEENGGWGPVPEVSETM